MDKTTRDAVPVSVLIGVRDWLYDNGQITMKGLWQLNRLIAKYGGYGDGKT